MLLDGDPVDFKSPKDALAAGVGMVYQHFRLVSNLTVAENLALGNPEVGLRLSQSELEAEARELGERYDFPVDPTARIWQLSVGQQQRVEILKTALSQCSHPDPRRAYGGAHPSGGSGAVPGHADAGRRGALADLRVAQAARGEASLGSCDRPA